MNKKLLICGAIATALFVTACVKKETPKEDENAVDTTEQSTASVELTAQPEQVIEPHPTEQVVEIQHGETANTSATIRREYSDAPAQSTPSRSSESTTAAATEAPTEPAPKPAKAENANPAPVKSNQNSAHSEDDAVAAAIAAATPALKN